VYACRIIVPGMSEIYPVDELEWENNSIANNIREAILNLSDLDHDECSDLLETLNESGLTDDRLVAALIGLAPGDNLFWKDLRVGELKTLLALSLADGAATAEGCEWVRQFGQVNPARSQIYACIETLQQLDAQADVVHFKTSLQSLYSAQTLQQARALLNRELRFFGEPSPGLSLMGCDMHQRLLAAYGKLHPRAAAGVRAA
jgi:ribosomal protein S12 methylthiotransferase accessory factor